MYFSASRIGFIPKDWKTDGTYSAQNWPKDALIATKEEIEKYWQVQPPTGRMLGSAGGRPAWVPLPAPPKKTREDVERDRLSAYASPINGSDRHFAELARLQAAGGSDEEIEAARAAGIARYAEIKEQNPWP